ncbi:glycosyltransferase family 2 protein [Pedobacter flavus]|uniref:Glycosyltransferase family 2 protein n=1 Tax=Pedobacter flavus TaxID=3113906 RepID=A0ABU7GXZ6_9SPHI|nr:glycosyltransferase family 2 protein [Pedobacter sp. VNH31]MEE1883902.1 glycosyltransferase family 2 protein [Pedobacter sp. VNH31]
MKISIITVVFNAERYIKSCMQSVVNQTYNDVEYIIIDGGSTDKTLEIINSFNGAKFKLISGKDNGMYDALNKGIKYATGEVVGFLHADDFYASNTIIEEIAQFFLKNSSNAIYGDLNYVHPDSFKVIRKWVSNTYSLKNIEQGWMPPHPTLFLKKQIYIEIGGYSLAYGSAADYEFILRLLYTYKVKADYFPQLIVNMRTGGMSNANIVSRIKAFYNDYKALRTHQVPFSFLVVFLKKFKKIVQYF